MAGGGDDGFRLTNLAFDPRLGIGRRGCLAAAHFFCALVPQPIAVVLEGVWGVWGAAYNLTWKNVNLLFISDEDPTS